MNSYTDDQMVSIAEVRAAYSAAHKGHGTFSFDQLLAELTKPPEPRLRDGCPVMYEHHGLRNCTDLITNLPSTAVNIRPLIPADKVMDWWDEWKTAGFCSPESADFGTFLTSKITAYTTEPSDE